MYVSRSRPLLTTLSPTHIHAFTQEHPLLGIPFYHIHPCEAAKLMAVIRGASIPQPHAAAHSGQVLQLERTSLERTPACNFIASWLSLFGPVVGLHIPAYMAAAARSEQRGDEQQHVELKGEISTE